MTRLRLKTDFKALLLTTALHWVIAPSWEASNTRPPGKKAEEPLVLISWSDHSALFDCKSSSILLFYFFSPGSVSLPITMFLFLSLPYYGQQIGSLTVWHALTSLREGMKLCLSGYLQVRQQGGAILPEPWFFCPTARKPYPEWMIRLGRHLPCYKLL